MSASDEPQVNYDPPVNGVTIPVPATGDPTKTKQQLGGAARARDGVRDGHGRFKATTDSIANDAECARLYDQGWTHRRIADHMGWKNHERSFAAVRRHLDRIPSQSAEAVRKQSAERLQEYREIALLIAREKHYAHSQGRVTSREDPDNPGHYIEVLDRGTNLQALARLESIEARLAKLFGADAPVRQEFSGDVTVGVELTGVDPADV